jgi:Domain of unknown function (DUF4082)
MLGRLATIWCCFWIAASMFGGSAVAQSVSLFANAVPNTLDSSHNAITVGVKFWSTQTGEISAIRFYRAAASPAGYAARLYSANGNVVAEADLAQQSGPVPGWQTATFATPVRISANTTYVAAYYAPSGQGSYSSNGLAQGVSVGPLLAPASSAVGGNGVYARGNAFPTKSKQATNYFVDVVFTPAVPAPYLSLSFNPPSPSIPSTTPLGSSVAKITATWSDGTPFSGTLSFGPPYSSANATFAISGNNLIINPAGPGVSADGGTTLNTTIVATQ